MTKEDRDFRLAVALARDGEVLFAYMPKGGYLRPGDEVELAQFLDDKVTIRARVLMADDYVNMNDIEKMAAATKVRALKVVKHYDVEPVDWKDFEVEDDAND